MNPRALPLGRPPVPDRGKPAVLDGRPDHRRLGPRPRNPDGVPAVRRGEETRPAPLRLLRPHGLRRERLPPRARAGTLPPWHLPGVQTGLPPGLRAVQEPRVT